MRAAGWRRRLWVVWLLAVHALLAFVIASSSRVQTLCRRVGLCEEPELSQYYHSRRGALRRKARASSDNLALVLGDSHMEGFSFERVDAFSLNAGIGGDTTVGVLGRLPDYEPLSRWSYVVLAFGYNDLHHRTAEAIVDNYRQILFAIPATQKVYAVGLMPVDESAEPGTLKGRNAKIFAVNELLRELTEQHRNVSYIELASHLAGSSGGLPTHFHVGDGVHLSPEGQARLASILGHAIPTSQDQRIAKDPTALPK